MVGEREDLAEELLHDGLQDGKAAAGDADVDLDGGPDERAGVGVGAVGEGDGGDGVGADDADGADAGETNWSATDDPQGNTGKAFE